MGNFLAVVAAESLQPEADRIFQSGLRIAQHLRNPAPSQFANTRVSRAVSFPRQNGSGTPIVCNAITGNWLLAIGTWFHSAGFASGEEHKLLQCYEEGGPVNLAREMEGFFTVAIGDADRNEVILITDVVGSCHSFVRVLPRALALSGSSLLLAALDQCTLDATACQEFLHTGVLYQDRTLFNEVRKLSAGTVYWFAGKELRNQHRYWDASEFEPESLDGHHAVSLLWESLTRAVKKISRVFKRPVCDLTGGYDSRALVAAFLSAAGPTFEATVSGPADSADSVVSKGLASLAGLAHRRFDTNGLITLADVKNALFFTDGEYDLVEYARILSIHRALAAEFNISINGSFGELARGYWWELLVPRTGKRGRLSAAKLARSRYVPRNGLHSLFRAEIKLRLVPHFAEVIEQTNRGLFDTPNTFQMDHAYLKMRMQRWQGRIASSTNRLWPCLSPFMFSSVLEVMLRTTGALRKRSLMVREMLARFQPKFASFPLEHGYPALPATWKNLHQFRPLLNHYGHKIMQRAGIMLPPSTQSGEPLRLRFWADEEVQAVLDPRSLRSAALLDEDGLRSFLLQSRQMPCSFDNEWSRLLSLELALRQVHDARRSSLIRETS